MKEKQTTPSNESRGSRENSLRITDCNRLVCPSIGVPGLMMLQFFPFISSEYKSV
jgi:hypothetical protein